MRQVKWFLVLVMGGVKLLLANDLNAFKKDMDLYLETMAKGRLNMAITYKLFDKNISGNPMQTTFVNLKIDGENKYVDNKHLTMYSNKEFSLVLQKEQKVAILSKTNKKTTTPNSLAQFMPDSLLFKHLTQVKLLYDTLGTKGYELSFNTRAQYRQWNIVFDTKNHTIQKSTIYYQNDLAKRLEEAERLNPKEADVVPVLVIEYAISELNVKPAFFQAKEVIKKSAGTYELLPLYQSYRLSNRLNKKK